MKRFKSMSKTKRIVAAGLTAGLTLGLASAAFAFWTSSGTGTGTGSTTAGSSDLTYTQNTLTPMYPGDSAQPLTVTVTNNSLTQSEDVTGVSAYITTSNAGCTGADFLLNGSPAPSTSGGAVALAWTATNLAASPGPGNSASTAGTDTIQFNDTLANQDNCKSAVVTLNYAS